jgi:hypothetical protein
MRRVAAMLLLAAGLAACGVVDTMVDGFKHTRAVESALETSLGTKPAVGFNWHNGRLTQVSVTFPQLLDDKPLRELAETVRAAVTTEFKQVPDNIVLGFALGKSTGKSARAE